MADLEPRTFATQSSLFGFSFLNCAVLFALIVVAGGCSSLSSLSKRSPKQDQAVAAREQGQLAQQYLHRGKLDEAEARFKHAIENCPDDVRLRHDLAIVRKKQGRVPEAISEMKKAVSQSGGEPEWLSELAKMQLSQGDLIGAWESADRAIERDPSLACAWRVRGDVFRQSSRLEDALRDYQRAVAEGDESPEMLMDVAEVYGWLGRPRRALSTLHRLTDSIPVEQHPRQLAHHRALAYQSLARHEEAIRDFQLARDIQGDDAHLLTQLAISQWELGETATAQQTLSIASELAPRNPQITSLLAHWQQEQDKQATQPRVAVAN